ncbi:MAG: hypothetical protein QXM43_06185, partial [Desulfurococcaceae archaeon]
MSRSKDSTTGLQVLLVCEFVESSGTVVLVMHVLQLINVFVESFMIHSGDASTVGLVFLIASSSVVMIAASVFHEK